MNAFTDPGVPITIKKFENFVIALEVIPTTGYTWKEEHDPALLHLLAPPKFLPDLAAIGAGGKEIFQFRAIQYGISQITMKYQRDWESTSKETKIFKVVITKK